VFCGLCPQNTPTTSLVTEIPIETSWTKSTPKDENQVYFQDSQNLTYLECSGFDYNKHMIDLNIPGRGTMQLEHLVCDVNGTLALDGQLFERMPRILTSLRDRLTLHLLTADTRGQQQLIDRQLNIQAVRIAPGNEAEQKADYVRKLGAEYVVAIGQGANDAEMLHSAAIGICIISPEGTAVETMLAADLVVPDIFSALELIEKPLRLIATLRK
jgi:P-type E1-E2 ATPase